MNYMMIDTETTNSLDDPFAYDVGFEVFDRDGNTIEIASLTNKDLFLDKNFMSTAYYAEKIPNYWKEIWAKERELLTWREIKWRVFDACKRNDCQIVAAHNAMFDNRALNLTQRYITTSQYRYFLPYGVTWWDTLKMAREVLGKDETYARFCEYFGYTTVRGKPRFTAEIVYKYISGDIDFEERHTGLEDVKIEKDIFLYCLDRAPDIDGRLWKPKPEPPRKMEPWEIELQELLA